MRLRDEEPARRSEMPAHLRVFNIDDWRDEIGPPSTWPRDLPDWPRLKGKLAWDRARRAWEEEHGVGAHTHRERALAWAARHPERANAAGTYSPGDEEPRNGPAEG